MNESTTKKKQVAFIAFDTERRCVRLLLLFVFGRSLVRFSTRSPAVLTDFSRVSSAHPGKHWVLTASFHVFPNLFAVILVDGITCSVKKHR
jgi:hypothetical protein